jgi:hypothetical protein
MKRMIISTLLLVLAAGTAFAAKTKDTPRVDVVFVLDTTGSMSGLIEGAKLKIWSIANSIVGGTPTPELRVGLVGYRDVGDSYVTRVFDLSSDLDEVYKNLMSFEADGGGDTPEHVNRALHDAVEDIAWSSDGRTLRILFLVGDAPPHTDYDDGFDYAAVCRTAVRRDIIINTIQCGGMAETVEFWREIALMGEGEYAAIAQSGGMRSIPTPMDEELSRLSADLDATVVAFGGRENLERKREADEMAAKMPAAAAAERGVYKSASGRMGGYDLVGAIESGEVELEDVKPADLPQEMRAMSAPERSAFIAQKKAERDEIRRQIAELNEKREAFIKAKLSEAGTNDSFDARVLSMIRSQAAGKGIAY